MSGSRHKVKSRRSPAANPSVATRNNLLARLPPADYQRVVSKADDVSLSFKQVLYEPGEEIDLVYFVEQGIVSLVAVLDDDDLVEVGTVGNEGMIGLPAFLGGETASSRAICQIAGRAKRLPSALLRDGAVSETLTQLLLRYSAAVMTMFAQTAACNRVHSLEQRLSRWLLMTLDRVGESDFPLTQEFMAQMLGVRRPSVSLAGATLQRAGLIRYSRGRITVIDRAGLEQASCECYVRIRDEFTRALELVPENGATRRRARARR